MSEKRLQRSQENMRDFMEQCDLFLSIEDEWRKTFKEEVSSLVHNWIAEIGAEIIGNSDGKR